MKKKNKGKNKNKSKSNRLTNMNRKNKSKYLLKYHFTKNKKYQKYINTTNIMNTNTSNKIHSNKKCSCNRSNKFIHRANLNKPISVKFFSPKLQNFIKSLYSKSSSQKDTVQENLGKIFVAIPLIYSQDVFANIKIIKNDIIFADRKIHIDNYCEVTWNLIKAFVDNATLSMTKEQIIKNVYLKDKDLNQISPTLRYSIYLRIAKLLDRTRSKLNYYLGNRIGNSLYIKWLFYNKKTHLWYFCYVFTLKDKHPTNH